MTYSITFSPTYNEKSYLDPYNYCLLESSLPL